MNYPPEILTDDLVRLRRSRAADASSIFEATSHHTVTHFMEWPRHTEISTTELFFAGCAERWESGAEFHWIIETPNQHDTAGCIAVRIREYAADFGYFLAPGFWGQGLASAAVHLILDWLKRQPEIVRIWASTDSENTRSLAVLERQGMIREGTLRMATIRPNISSAPRDTAIFGLCRADY